MIKAIEGEMGKGGAGATVAKDTLISEQSVKTLFVIGEGVIEGVQEIYLDTIPIGSFDAVFEDRIGTANQEYIPGFVDVESALPGFNAREVIRDSTRENGKEYPNVYYPNTTLTEGQPAAIFPASSIVGHGFYRIVTLGDTNWGAISPKQDKLDPLYEVGSEEPFIGKVFRATSAGDLPSNKGSGTVNHLTSYDTPWSNLDVPSYVDALRMTFTLSALFQVQDGNVKGYKVEYLLQVKASPSSTWQTIPTNPIKGKSSGGYSFDVTVERPTGVGTTPWSVRVQRITRDDPSDKRQSVLTWATSTQIFHKKLNYPNSALVGVTLNKAEQFGNRIPEVMFRVKGKLVKIPSNYNPETRVYTGVWDGTFNELTKFYTNNPAWILLDILTDVRSGVGLSFSDIDTFSIYNLAKFSDDLISNAYVAPIIESNTNTVLQEGYQLQIPRFTLDYSFQTRSSISEILSQVLSICNATLITNEFGQVAVTFQHPGQAVTRNVTNANVVNGDFTYQSSNLEQRTNLVNVTYNNGDNYGRTDTATVQETDLQAIYGLQSLDIVLPGCYHRVQALRKARWALYTNNYFTSFVTFSVFMDGLNYKIGDLIRVFDNYSHENQMAGIVTASGVTGGNTTITLDREITLPSGTYTFYIYDKDGVEVSKVISGGVTLSTISVSGTKNIVVNSPFVISGTPAGKIYRVTNISKQDEGLYDITGLEFDDAIFDYIDSGILVEPSTGDYANVGQFSVPAVSSVTVTESFGTNGTLSTGKLTISWVWDAAHTQKYRANFKLAWSVDNGTVTTVEKIGSDNFDIVNPVPGEYSITIWAVNPLSGILSAGYTYNTGFRTENAVSTLYPPINLRVTGTAIVSPQPTTLEFATPALSLSFDYNPLNSDVPDALYNYLVEVYEIGELDVTKVGSYSVEPAHGVLVVDSTGLGNDYTALDGTFELSFNENVNIFGGTPARTFQVWIYSKDIIGDLSAPAKVTVTNPVPDFTHFELMSDIGKMLVTITPSTEIDVKNYIVYRGNTSTFTPTTANIVYKGVSSQANIPTTDTSKKYYRCAISDSFGETGLNVSDAIGGSSVDLQIHRYTYSGLQFSTDESTDTVSWSSFVATKEDGTQETIEAGSAVWASGTMYLYYVPGDLILHHTTDPVVAVSGRILATYLGGTNITADGGKAFIDGDQIIAGSLLTNALATNLAYITNMAMIGNIIQSDNYSDGDGGVYAGWRLDKNGMLHVSSIVMKDSDGQVIFASGTGFDWANVTGNGIPDIGATRNVFRGDWQSGTYYSVGDIVLDSEGYGWSCIFAHTAGGSALTPIYPTSSNTYWTLYTVKGSDGIAGQVAVTIDLESESDVTVALEDGTGYALPPANKINLYEGGVIVTSGVVYSGSSVQKGLTATVRSSTGDITFSGTAWTSDQETFAFQALYKGVTYTATYTIAKSKKGSSAVFVDLLSEADVVAATHEGVVATLPTGNALRLYVGGTVVTTGVTYEGTTTQNGLTLRIDTAGNITLTQGS